MKPKNLFLPAIIACTFGLPMAQAANIAANYTNGDTIDSNNSATVGAGDRWQMGAISITIASGGFVDVQNTSESTNTTVGQVLTSSITVDGGALTFNGPGTSLVGNGPNGNGTIDVRAGSFSSTPGANLFIGRDRAVGTVIIRGGTVNFGKLPTFDAVSGANPPGNGSIDFADKIGGGTSDGTLTITGADSTYYEGLYTAGDLTINGSNVTPFALAFTVVGQTISANTPPTPANWTGTNGSTWDAATTANFVGDPSDPFTSTTFDVATSDSNAVVFADTYPTSGGSDPVGTYTVNIASGGVQTGGVTFSNDSDPYVVSSADTNGIMGSTEVETSGSSTVTLLGTHAYTGTTSIEAGSTLVLGNGSTDGSIANSPIANDSSLIVNNTAAVTLNGTTSGGGSLEKLGAGTLTFAGNSPATGPVTLSSGTLVYQGTANASAYDIAASTVLEIDRSAGGSINILNNTLISGSGTLRKTGSGEFRWSAGAATFELGSGSLIDVQEGILRGGSGDNEVWTNNYSDLFVASGASFLGVEANVRVDALDGAGTVTSGFNVASYTGFTFGVDGGSGTFDGMLANQSAPGNFVKVGSGTQTLTGINFYTGNTTIEAGAITLANGGELTMAPGADGVSNVIAGVPSGSGTINLNGALYLDLAGADATNGNSWLLVNDSNLTVNYGATFAIASSLGAFTENAGVWSFVDGDTEWKFTESTGLLEYSAPSGYSEWLSLYPGLSDTTPGGDPENDGIVNQLEYVLNGDPEVSDPAILPMLDASGENFVFTFTRRVESADDTTQVFQYGSDLSGWNDLDIESASEVQLGTPAGGLQTVTVTIAKSLEVDGKLFGRLMAEQ